MEKQEFTDKTKEFESLMAKSSKEKQIAAGMVKLKKAIEKLAKQNGEPGIMKMPKKVVTVGMADRYRVAFKKTYDKQKDWRRNEIDNELKSGKLCDSSWNDDFVQQVASLAESDDPLEA